MLTGRQLALGIGGPIIGAALWFVLVVDFFGIMPVRKPFRNYYPIPMAKRHNLSTNMVVGQWEGVTFEGQQYLKLSLNRDGTGWVVEQSTGTSRLTNAIAGKWWIGEGEGFEDTVVFSGRDGDRDPGRHFRGVVSIETIRDQDGEVAKVMFLTRLGIASWYTLLRCDHMGRLRSAAHELENEMREGTVQP